MRLPFIQLDSDFIRHGAPALALELGVSTPHALGLASMLWEWAASKDGDDCAPSGLVTGKNAAAHVERAAGWDGEKGRLVAALQEPEVGLLEAIPDGFRVRGLDRYRDAWEKQQKERQRWHQRKEGVKPGASATPPTERQRSTDGKMQTQMNTQTHTPPSGGTRVPREAPQAAQYLPDDTVPHVPPRTTPDTSAAEAFAPEAEPMGPSLFERFCAEYKRRQGKVYPGSSEGHPTRQDATAWGDVLRLAREAAGPTGDAEAEALRTWCIALDWKGYPQCYSVRDLAKHWPTYAKPQVANAAPFVSETHRRAPTASAWPKYDNNPLASRPPATGTEG